MAVQSECTHWNGKEEDWHKHIYLSGFITESIQTKSTVIWAEIPDVDVELDLHEVLTKIMKHGSWVKLSPNSSCEIKGKCSKLYSGAFTGNDGYLLYRRRW